MPETTEPATAALTTAYLAGALALLGVAFLMAAFVFAFALHDWQRAFYALLWSYPIGSWGDRMIKRARWRSHDAQRVALDCFDRACSRAGAHEAMSMECRECGYQPGPSTGRQPVATLSPATRPEATDG